MINLTGSSRLAHADAQRPGRPRLTRGARGPLSSATVIQALRAGNIQIVELHNHGLTEQPRLFYMHYWAVGDAVTLAKALRPALDATNLLSP